MQDSLLGATGCSTDESGGRMVPRDVITELGGIGLRHDANLLARPREQVRSDVTHPSSIPATVGGGRGLNAHSIIRPFAWAYLAYSLSL